MDAGRIRRKRGSFTVVSNQAMRDKSLSLKAKGLYSLIQSYIDMEAIGFVVYKTYLQNNCCSDGRDSFNSAWNELIKTGYLEVSKKRTEKGTYAYEYTIIDDPSSHPSENLPKGQDNGTSITPEKPSSKPDTGFPYVVSPEVDNPPLEKPELDQPSTESPSLNKKITNQTLRKNIRHNNTDISSNTDPESYLRSLQNGAPLSKTDKRTLEALAKYGFSNEVSNILLSYVLEVSQNRLISSFVEMVAGEWARDGVRTKEDAIRETEKTFHKKSKRALPEYFQNNSGSKRETISEEEAREVEEKLRSMSS